MPLEGKELVEHLKYLEEDKKRKDFEYEMELRKVEDLRSRHLLTNHPNQIPLHQKFYDILKEHETSEQEIFLNALEKELPLYFYHVFDNGIDATFIRLNESAIKCLYYQGQAEVGIENIFTPIPYAEITNFCFRKKIHHRKITKKDILINKTEFISSSKIPRPLNLRVARKLDDFKEGWPRNKAAEFLKGWGIIDERKQELIKTLVYGAIDEDELSIAEECFDALYSCLDDIEKSEKRHDKNITSWLKKPVRGFNLKTKSIKRIVLLINPNPQGNTRRNRETIYTENIKQKPLIWNGTGDPSAYSPP